MLCEREWQVLSGGLLRPPFFVMAASPVEGAPYSSPLPSTWRYECTEEDLARIDSSLQSLSSCALIGRMVSQRPPGLLFAIGASQLWAPLRAGLSSSLF